MSHGSSGSAIDIDEFERRLRSPAPRSPGDPLAELARLVTTSDAEPHALDAMFARPRGVADRYSSHGDETTSIDLGALRGPMVGSDGFAADAQQYPHEYAHENARDTHAREIHAHEIGGRYAEDDLERDSHSGDRYRGDDALEAEWTEPHAAGRIAPESSAPRSRRPLYATAAVIAVGLLGIGSTFAFKGRSGAGDLVEVKAAPGPTKIQAQATANSGIAPSDSTVLDRGATPQSVTRVVDRQERPVDLSDAAKAPRQAQTASSSSQMASLAAAAASGTSSGSIFSEPRKVKTVSVRPDGTVVGNPTVDTAPAAAPAQSSSQTSPQASQASSSAKSATPKTAARVATTPKPPVEKPETAKAVAARPEPAIKPVKSVAAKPAPVKVARAVDTDDDATGGTETAAPAPRASSGGGGGFAVQLAAPGSEAEARSTASRLGQKYSDALGGARVTVQKAGDKAVYRVRTASMSREDAVSACEKVKAAGGACFVAKN